MSLFSPPLQAFMAVAAHKTVHGAAAAIHLTQTGVTQRIRALEEKLSTTLFIRTRRGMVLTPEGEALLRYCHSADALENDMLAKIKGAGVNSPIELCITGPTSIMRSRVIPQCLPVMKKFPQLLMQFDITDLENNTHALRADKAQLAVIQAEDVVAEMASKLLKPEKYVLVCSAAWKHRKSREIIKTERIIDYNASDKMTFNYLKSFGLFEYAHHERHFANRTESLAALIMAGLGYGVLTLEFSKPYLDHEQLILLNNGKIYENHMALAWYHRPEPPAYFAALIQAIG